MATYQIKIRNGFFEGEATPTYVCLPNGWEASIEQDGSIFCEYSKEYIDGEYSIRFVIQKDGFAKLTLKTPYEFKVIKKGFVVQRGQSVQDGVIGLSGGHIKERYAYFRDASFEKFLDKYGITAVKHINPNKEYNLRDAKYGGGECESKIWTDGKSDVVDFDEGRTIDWRSSCLGSSAYEKNTIIRVSGSTWVVVETKQDEYNNHNHVKILYTLEKKPMKLDLSYLK